jgi:hypothetical protein
LPPILPSTCVPFSSSLISLHGPILLYEDNKATINMVDLMNEFGITIFYTSRSKNRSGAATSSAHISLVPSTQRTLRTIHSVGFYIADKLAALWATWTMHSFNFRSRRAVSHGIIGTLEQPAVVLHLYSMTSTLSLWGGVAAQVVGGPIYSLKHNSKREKTNPEFDPLENVFASSMKNLSS